MYSRWSALKKKRARLSASASRPTKRKAQTRKKVSLEDLFASVQAGETKELQLIVKADVQGSLEPIMVELEKLGQG